MALTRPRRRADAAGGGHVGAVAVDAYARACQHHAGCVPSLADVWVDMGGVDRPAADPLGRRHLWGVYASERALADSAAAFLVPALEEGQAAIVVTRPGHARDIEAAIGAHGLDVEGAKRAGQLVSLDAAALLASLPDRPSPPEQLQTMLLETLALAATGSRPVQLVSELGALLWQHGRSGAALAVEKVCTELAAKWPLTLLCPYLRPHAGSSGRTGAELDFIRGQHTGVVSDQTATEDPAMLTCEQVACWDSRWGR